MTSFVLKTESSPASARLAAKSASMIHAIGAIRDVSFL